jgi:hypothetical protein
VCSQTKQRNKFLRFVSGANNANANSVAVVESESMTSLSTNDKPIQVDIRRVLFVEFGFVSTFDVVIFLDLTT